MTQATVLGRHNPEMYSVRGDKKYLQLYFGWRVANILNKHAIFLYIIVMNLQPSAYVTVIL